jgi:hypothetical protein
MRWLSVCLIASCAAAAELPNVVFLEPAEPVNTASAEISANMPLYRRAADAAKYEAWLRNESAQRALRLYAQASRIFAPGANVPDYYIALVQGGNHAAVGFRLATESGAAEFPRTAYILLDADPERFETTMFHETGHVVVDMLAGGRRLDGLEIASIPHHCVQRRLGNSPGDVGGAPGSRRGLATAVPALCRRVWRRALPPE